MDSYSLIKRMGSAEGLDYLVVLVGLKVGQRGVAGGGERHDLHPSVDQALVIQLLEDPPGGEDSRRDLNTAGKEHCIAYRVTLNGPIKLLHQN